jgi:hypothetical protein
MSRAACLGIATASAPSRMWAKWCMIETRSVGGWSEYLQEIRCLARSYSDGRRPPLFRGLASCKWSLQTTLERYFEDEKVPNDPSFLSYYRRASLSPKSAVETLIGRRWDNFPDYWKVADGAERNSVGWLDRLLAGQPEIYEFFIYLRHHGYPSPLLDWTASPYVAAFFAFDAVNREETPASAAVYAFVPDSSGGVFRSEAQLSLVGPYGRSHARHLSQQSWYTWCVERKAHDYLIRPHDEIIAGAAEPDGKVLKLVIPAAERLVALKELDLMNVNAFSLFGSEDSLVRTVARRELLFKK